MKYQQKTLNLIQRFFVGFFNDKQSIEDAS